MGAKFTGKAGRALNRALQLAKEFGHTYIGSEHILLGLLGEEECIASGVLEAGGVSYEGIKTLVCRAAGVGEATNITPADMTPKAKKVIEDAAKLASDGVSGYIGTEHLLGAILSDPDTFGCKMIAATGASVIGIRSELAVFLNTDGIGKKVSKSEIRGAPTLSKYGVSLVAASRRGFADPVIGREAECERVMQILSRRTKNNPCLVGEPGVGKTAIVEGLSALIAKREVPDVLLDKNIVSLDISSMIAGAKYRGEFEERMKNVMEEVKRERSIILFIDELHTIIGAGAAEGAVDAANILKPALSRGDVQIIGATTL
ncbi:MAG: ATP-dependent Clp protease ATP-binding subunit, partial [Clostridia bacterium]|nr:ATP-dependent Clp protease ATP-binding subunit [Clostridia bacterium]